MQADEPVVVKSLADVYEELTGNRPEDAKPSYMTLPKGVDMTKPAMIKNGQSYVWRDGQWKPEWEGVKDEKGCGDMAYELPSGHKVYHQFIATVTRNGGSIKVGCSDLSSMPRLMSEAWEAMAPIGVEAYPNAQNSR